MHKKILSYVEHVIKKPSMFFRPDKPEDLENQLHGISYALELKHDHCPNTIIRSYIYTKWKISTNCGWADAVKCRYKNKSDYQTVVVNLLKRSIINPYADK